MNLIARIRRWWHCLTKAPWFEHRAADMFDQQTEETTVIGCTCGAHFWAASPGALQVWVYMAGRQPKQ